MTSLKLRTAGIQPEEYLEFLQAKLQLLDVGQWNAKIQDKEMREQIESVKQRLITELLRIQDAPKKLSPSGNVYHFYIPQLLEMTKQYAQLETLGVYVKDSDCAKQIKEVLAAYPEQAF